MSISRYMARICTHTLVYWSPGELQTDGTFAFGEPEERPCFWKDIQEDRREDASREFVSHAEVYVLEQYENGGMIFLGTLNDLTVDEQANPLLKKETLDIKVSMKTPLMGRAGEFQFIVRAAWRN